jgi:hypothetical protein
MAITTYPFSGSYGPLSQEVFGFPGLQLEPEILQNLARFYTPHGFVYNDIVTPQNVMYNNGVYPVFDPTSLFGGGTSNMAVADDAPTPKIDVNYGLKPYQTADYRLATQITRKEMVQANPALRLEYAKTQALLTQFATNKEVRLASLLLPPNLGGSLTQTALLAPTGATWDSGTSTTPAAIQTDLQTAILSQYKVTGIRPNTLVIGLEVAMAIGNDFTIKDQIKYQIGPESVTGGWENNLPPTLFGLKIVIADGTLYNSGRPGDPLSLADTWGNYARVMYVDPNAQWGQPSVVYALRGRITDGAGDSQPPGTILPVASGNGVEPGAPGQSIVVDRWWELDPPLENIRVWENVVEQLVAPDLCTVIGPVLTTF